MKRKMVWRSVATGLAAMGLCLTAGCTATDTVTPRFPALEANIDAARSAGAETYAPTPLRTAEIKLEGARAAVAAGEMAVANRLVDEAMVDADFARVQAPTERAGHEATELRRAIQALRDEISQQPEVPRLAMPVETLP